MKKLFVIGFAMLLGMSAMAQNITGSAHDFSGDAWNSSGEICIVCHTPHNADITVSDAALWNHDIDNTTTYTLYSTTTLTATDLAQPSGVSKLCLSCHDGTVALDNFGGTTTGTNYVTGAFNVDTDLSDDHPVSFTYDSALASADGGLNDPSVDTTSLGGTIAADLLVGGTELECSSCHDVHNAYGNSSLLVIANTTSALCLTCHDK